MDDERSRRVMLTVGGETDPRKLGWSIVRYHEEGERLELSAVGVAAISAALKGVIEANKVLSSQGATLYVRPYYATVEDDREEGRELTVVRLRLHASA